jgi:hypothetical protein
MMDCRKWMQLLNKHWTEFQNKCAPEHAHFVLRQYHDEMSWLLHEALPQEWFYCETVETRTGQGTHYWHIDGGYLRVLFTVQGEGTIAARSFKDDVATPPGYAIIMTGQQRSWKVGIGETWHTAPKDSAGRRLLLLNFRNAE